MASDRIQVVVDRLERERFRTQASREGLSLSEWMREAARERLLAREQARRRNAAADLEALFRECDLRHQGEGPELEWEEMKRILDEEMSRSLATE